MLIVQNWEFLDTLVVRSKHTWNKKRFDTESSIHNWLSGPESQFETDAKGW